MEIEPRLRDQLHFLDVFGDPEHGDVRVERAHGTAKVRRVHREQARLTAHHGDVGAACRTAAALALAKLQVHDPGEPEAEAHRARVVRLVRVVQLHAFQEQLHVEHLAPFHCRHFFVLSSVYGEKLEI